MTAYAEHATFGRMVIEKVAFSHWDNLHATNASHKQAWMRENFIAAMKFPDITVET